MGVQACKSADRTEQIRYYQNCFPKENNSEINYLPEKHFKEKNIYIYQWLKEPQQMIKETDYLNNKIRNNYYQIIKLSEEIDLFSRKINLYSRKITLEKNDNENVITRCLKRLFFRIKTTCTKSFSFIENTKSEINRLNEEIEKRRCKIKDYNIKNETFEEKLNKINDYNPNKNWENIIQTSDDDIIKDLKRDVQIKINNTDYDRNNVEAAINKLEEITSTSSDLGKFMFTQLCDQALINLLMEITKNALDISDGMEEGTLNIQPTPQLKQISIRKDGEKFYIETEQDYQLKKFEVNGFIDQPVSFKSKIHIELNERGELLKTTVKIVRKINE